MGKKCDLFDARSAARGQVGGGGAGSLPAIAGPPFTLTAEMEDDHRVFHGAHRAENNNESPGDLSLPL